MIVDEATNEGTVSIDEALLVVAEEGKVGKVNLWFILGMALLRGKKGFTEEEDDVVVLFALLRVGGESSSKSFTTNMIITFAINATIYTK